jgi:hypothetical protein
LNDCLIWEFQRRQMRQPFSTRFLQRFIHNFRRDELREPLTLIKRIHDPKIQFGTRVTRPSDTSLR